MPLRVLIVDDSSFAREVLREALSRYPDIEIVGEASNGKRAEKLVAELSPDVVTMDVIMPLVGGLEAIESIMARCPTPIVVVSDADSELERMSLAAMEAGAIDFFPKPRTGFDRDTADRLADALRVAAQVRVRGRAGAVRSTRSDPERLRIRLRRVEFIGVVASTGGPQTLRRLIGSMAGGKSRPVAIVQHTSVGFSGAFASWLASVTGLDVQLARDGERVAPGTLVVAPDDHHLEIRPGGIAHLHQRAKLGSHRPSGTLLLRSLAASFGSHAAGVVLTGMGDDGAAGAHALYERGGLVLVEEPGAAILEGMPKAALARAPGAIVAPADEIGRMLATPYPRGVR